MAIRKIARMGHPVLRQPARDLSKEELQSPEIQALVEDLFETMEEYGGIGIAAPQVHEPVKLAIIDYDEDLGPVVIANPMITVLDETLQGHWEGCLSVPELRGFVERPRKVKIDYWDLEGNAKSIIAEDFLATVFQHELDHLFGTLFIDRIRTEPGKTKLAFTEEFSKYHRSSDATDLEEDDLEIE